MDCIDKLGDGLIIVGLCSKQVASAKREEILFPITHQLIKKNTCG